MSDYIVVYSVKASQACIVHNATSQKDAIRKVFDTNCLEDVEELEFLVEKELPSTAKAIKQEVK